MQNHMKLSFDSLSQNESFARTVAAAFFTQLNPTIEELTDVRTAVSEAVTNAIIHGYASKPGVIEMECRICGGELTVSISDTGRGIADVELARQPFYTSVPELERSGMGFAVMEAFMDSVDVASRPGEGTCVTMRKIIRKDGCES